MRSIPSIIDLLRPEQKLEFKHFNTQFDDYVPRLQCATHSARTTDEDQEQSFRQWQLTHLNIRSQPFQVDPVISSERSNAEFEADRDNMRFILRGGRGPSLDKLLSKVFDADLVLASPSGNIGVSL